MYLRFCIEFRASLERPLTAPGIHLYFQFKTAVVGVDPIRPRIGPYSNMHRVFLGLTLLCICVAAHALKSAAPAETSIEGRWVVNRTLSDDGEALLALRIEAAMKEERRMEEQRRRRLRDDPRVWEPEFTPPERTPQHIAAMEERQRRQQQMLGLTQQLDIQQVDFGAQLTIASDFETRRLDAGARSQVSLPEGQLADATSGWDGEWFVIERSARSGPRITEKLRRLKKTDQLEQLVTIRGSSMLSGLKVRRVFDRAPADVPIKRDDGAGPPK